MRSTECYYRFRYVDIIGLIDMTSKRDSNWSVERNPAIMSKIELLKGLNFGSSTAEEERDRLSEYFVKTNAFQGLVNDQYDFVLGEKGSGKSALFLLLQDKKLDLLIRNNTRLISAENPRGEAVFKNLATDPPASERELELIWRTYFLVLIARFLVSTKNRSRDAKSVIEAITSAGLMDKGVAPLSLILKSVRDFVRRIMSSEVSVSIDPSSGAVTFGGRLGDLRGEENYGDTSLYIGILLASCENALKGVSTKIWILLDRLDVAFEESEILEKNALRALLKCYLNMKSLDSIKLKVFLRSDIFDKITDGGFREASHITRVLQLTWSRDSIQNIIIRRAISNRGLIDFYKVDKIKTEASIDMQTELFNRIFPTQVESGLKKSKTIDWIIKRITDGKGRYGPREAINFINSLVRIQVDKLQIGSKEPDSDSLFDRSIFKDAFREVSNTRCTTVLYAEYPSLRRYIESLRDKKSSLSLGYLASLWKKEIDEAEKIAVELVKIGFFDRKENLKDGNISIPFLYRPALAIKQGTHTEL